MFKDNTLSQLAQDLESWVSHGSQLLSLYSHGLGISDTNCTVDPVGIIECSNELASNNLTP